MESWHVIAEIAIWIPTLLSDGAWLLCEQEQNGENDEYGMRRKQCATKPLQISEGLRPTIPKRQ